MLKALSTIIRPLNPGLMQAIERFAHSNTKLLTPIQHMIADLSSHPGGITAPLWAYIFPPARTWVGLTRAQRAWGGTLGIGVGFASYETGFAVGEALFGGGE